MKSGIALGVSAAVIAMVSWTACVGSEPSVQSNGGDSGAQDASVSDAGADSGNVGDGGGDGGPLTGSGTTSDPFQTDPPLADCHAYKEAYPASADGYFSIAPQAAVFTDLCNMSIAGGGWTLVTEQYATALGSTNHTYLYLLNGSWYESPASTLSWSWSFGQQLTGTYTYFGFADGGTGGTFDCTGSSETIPFGVGCSNGSGPNQKCIPVAGGSGNCSGSACAAPDIASGTGSFCDDVPNAFGNSGSPCASGVQVFAR